MRAWPVALVLAALLLVPASASARGSVVPQDVRAAMAGPVFAGERLVWATEREPDEGLDFHLAAPDGTAHRQWRFKAPTGVFGFNEVLSLGASAERVAAGLNIYGCHPSCKYQNYETLYAGMLTAPTGDAPAKFADSCGGGSIHWQVAHVPSVDVSANVVAHEPCLSSVAVRDFGAPPPGTSDFAGRRPRIAGEYLALHEGAVGSGTSPAERALVLRRWRAGTEVARVSGDVASYDVQEDGKLAFAGESDGAPAVMWVEPGSPLQHFVDHAPLGARNIRIARDRIAWEDGGGTHVRTVGGARVAFSPTAAVGDFDGERLTWATRPCALLGIATWDLEGQAPAFEDARCPLAAPASGTLRASHLHGATRVRIQLACPAKPALGCGGVASLWGRDTRRRRRHAGALDLAEGSILLKPGETKAVTLQYEKHRVCIAGRSGLRPLLRIRFRGRTARHRVRVAGLEPALAAC